MRFVDEADVFDDVAQAVLDHAAAAGSADEGFLLRQFHAFLAHVFHVGKAHHVGHHFALWIKALVFLALVDAVDAQLGNLVGHVHLDLAFQVNEAAVRIELLAQFVDVHFQQTGQRIDFFR
ncbi:hypothetical protein D3C72_1817320 [compost metagenome]